MSFKLPESKGMLIDGVAASQCIDSSGEVLDIDGVDCSQFEEEGGILLNWEHRDGDLGADTIVGKVVYYHKVLKESDCENDRQRMYWKRVRETPYIYVVCRLFDGSGHEKAKAIAAIIRDNAAHDEPLACRFSIEGATTKKDGNSLKESIWRKLAVTVKPCNKTAVSGLLADNASPADMDKSEPSFQDPTRIRLGGAVELECNPILDPKEEASLRLLATAGTLKAVRKALTAGNMDVAPSARTGGAALQREDLGAQAKATLRDYGWRKKFKRDEFKAFAKSKMPEVSDDFLDHFADVAESYSIKKSVLELAKALPAAKPVKAKAPAVIIPKEHQAAPKETPGVIEDISDADEAPKKLRSNLQAGTFRGKKLKPNPEMTRPEFDAKKGVLHTPIGSFKAYLPKHDGAESEAHYQRLLSHPDIEGAMDHALENWTKVHKLLKAGKLPPEVVMHAVLFSQLSPNKPVPTQELQYARLVDAMDATGIDPRYPNFHEIEEPYRNLDQPNVLPHTSREEFARNPSYWQGGIIGPRYNDKGERVHEDGGVAKPSDTGRYPGDLLSGRPLFQDFLGRANDYHKLHDSLVDLVGRHRHNGLAAIAELMNSKQAGTNHANVRRAALKAGKPDPGEFKGLKVPGIKVKTGLYMYGMLGGGDSLVPDTHEVRNLYGLDLQKDQHTIEYLKQMHWRPTNMGTIMHPLNQWYLKNHPAVQYTLNHPKWGQHFERPQDALFPAFWRHWLTIAPHEQHLGLPNESEQAGTTHAPYWDTIRPYVDEALGKSEDGHDSSIALRTALVHQLYVQHFGEVPAMMMYHRFLVPKLLEAARHREAFGRGLDFMAKANELQAGLIELRKNIDDVLNGRIHGVPEVHSVSLRLGGKMRGVGRYMVHEGKLHHLEDYHGVLQAMVPEGPLTATTVARLHGLEFAPHFVVAPHEAPLPEQRAQAPAAEQAPEVQTAIDAPPPPPPVFEYFRPGMVKPHVVEFGAQGAALDGRKLDDTELNLMLANAQKGLATIRYRRGTLEESPVMKSLRKDENDVMDPADALTHVRAAVAAGHVHPDVERALTRHIYEDKMTPGIGNKYAYTQFRAQNKPGVYVSGDLNDFKSVNDLHGHDAGDAAIVGAGSALRSAADKVGTGKLFRPGGDEFVAHFPTHEDAVAFARHATKHLDAVPPVNGVHKLSISMGLGNDFGSADKALLEAKKQKVDPKTGQRAFAVGKVPHLAHSAVPGSEGPIPLTPPAAPTPHLPKPAATPAPKPQA